MVSRWEICLFYDVLVNLVFIGIFLLFGCLLLLLKKLEILLKNVSFVNFMEIWANKFNLLIFMIRKLKNSIFFHL